MIANTRGPRRLSAAGPPPAPAGAAPRPAPRPDADERARAVAARAFQIYRDRNGAPGDALSDWLQAERELAPRGPAA